MLFLDVKANTKQRKESVLFPFNLGMEHTTNVRTMLKWITKCAWKTLPISNNAKDKQRIPLMPMDMELIAMNKGMITLLAMALILVAIFMKPRIVCVLWVMMVHTMACNKVFIFTIQ